MMNKLKGLVKEEQGQGMTEYGLVLGVLAIGVIAILVTLRTEITDLFQKAVDSIKTAGSPTTTTTTTNP